MLPILSPLLQPLFTTPHPDGNPSHDVVHLLVVPWHIVFYPMDLWYICRVSGQAADKTAWRRMDDRSHGSDQSHSVTRGVYKRGVQAARSEPPHSGRAAVLYGCLVRRNYSWPSLVMRGRHHELIKRLRQMREAQGCTRSAAGLSRQLTRSRDTTRVSGTRGQRL